MTNNENSNEFLSGLFILDKYKTEDFSINVVEQSTIAINGLNIINKKDTEKLNLFGWETGKDNDGGSYAQFFQLEYIDL